MTQQAWCHQGLAYLQQQCGISTSTNHPSHLPGTASLQALLPVLPLLPPSVPVPPCLLRSPGGLPAA